MRRLEDLVPPRKLCQKIPAGEFVDSCFTWCIVSPAFLEGMGHSSVRNNKWLILNTPLSKRKLPGILQRFPAPTLKELMEALGSADCVKWRRPIRGMHWLVKRSDFDDGLLDDSPEAAMLRLYLEARNRGTVTEVKDDQRRKSQADA